MANAIFDIARKKFAKGEIKWNDVPIVGAGSSGIRALLFDTSPADGQGNAINMTALLASATSMTGFGLTDGMAPNGGGMGNCRSIITVTGLTVEDNGACNAPQITFPSVPSSPGNSSTGILIVAASSGDNILASSFPLVWIDSATGLPITPNGGNIIVTWDTGVNKIFRL